MSLKQNKNVKEILEKGQVVAKAQDRFELKYRKSYLKYRRFHNKYCLEGTRRAMKSKAKFTPAHQASVNKCQGYLFSREADRREIMEINQCLARR